MPRNSSGNATSSGEFGNFLRRAVSESERGGVVSFDNFAKFTDVRMMVADAPTNAMSGVHNALQAGVAEPSQTNRDRFGSNYSDTGLPVVWDAAGDERRTPGGGNPDEIINLIYELKALGISSAERFWYGADNGGQDHLDGFNLLNQSKWSIMLRNDQLLSPEEYRSLGLDMMKRGK